MLPAFLITFREVIEASLIVATIMGILIKLQQKKEIKIVWMATLFAAIVSFLLLVGGRLLGIKVQEIYTGKVEVFTEGILMMVSAVFITWAVFFLHKYFASYKTRLLHKIKKTIENEEQKGLFILVFTAVFREGFEIVLFLSTIYFSSTPDRILLGFGGGLILALLITYAFVSATLRLPVYYLFKTTSILLILFAAGLLVRGVHEFAEAGIIPEMTKIQFFFIPEKTTFAGELIKAVFGLTQKMDYLQIAIYISYVLFMVWWVFLRKRFIIS